jgi:hypothetical protein
MATGRKQFSVRLPAETEALLYRLVDDMSEAAGCRVMVTSVVVAAIETLAEKRGLSRGEPVKRPRKEKQR